MTSGTARSGLAGKKRVVIATFGSFGDLNPSVGLALGLKARGHDPVVATAEVYRPYVEAEGIEFRPVRPDLDHDDSEAVGRIMDPRRVPEYVFKELLLPRVRESYEDLSEAARGANLLVTNSLAIAGPLLAEKEGMAWASAVLAPISFFSANDVPVFPPFPRLAALGRLGPGAGRTLVELAKRSTRGWLGPVTPLRSELGLPPGEHPIHEGQFSPGLILAMFSRVLANPQPDWPPNARITCHVLYDGSSGALPEDLGRFLDSGEPPVVFTLGTSAVGAAGAFYRESIEAARLLEVRAVLLVGRDPRNRPREKLPEGVAVFERAPLSGLFPRARAVVHQGGAGTTAHALRAGRPQLVVPFSHDQPDNARRVTDLGVARTLYPRRYSARRAADRLKALLGDPAYRARLVKVAEEVRSEDGVVAGLRRSGGSLCREGGAGAGRRLASGCPAGNEPHGSVGRNGRQKTVKAIVVGAGIGGLAAASRRGRTWRSSASAPQHAAPVKLPAYACNRVGRQAGVISRWGW